MSEGMLKLVLRLELPLPERPGLLLVENEARRGEGGSTGDGEEGGGEGADDLPSSKAGISVWRERNYIRFVWHTYHPRLRPIQRCSVHMASLALLSSSDYPSVALLVRYSPRPIGDYSEVGLRI